MVGEFNGDTHKKQNEGLLKCGIFQATVLFSIPSKWHHVSGKIGSWLLVKYSIRFGSYFSHPRWNLGGFGGGLRGCYFDISRLELNEALNGQKNCHCKGVNWMEVTKTEGFSEFFTLWVRWWVPASCWESKQFLCCLRCEVLGIFFWSVRFSQKWRLPEDYFLNWNGKDCVALILFCVFFVVPDDQTCTEKCGHNV